ncbi:hypothetical protein OU798_04475 [Prolixibacteraceae bacterium Z1-6]|uniref:Uncharacterized protein n=1 Tax=Draconibacterium aestuarii TaxID=2998507 RepID=A0A9X3F4B0_9BACT|nr:hypothetical protein [Prolixibacteraceae bacterium Z1-6]
MRKSNINLIYEGLAVKNPQFKERGFDAFSQDMKDYPINSEVKHQSILFCPIQ